MQDLSLMLLRRQGSLTMSLSSHEQVGNIQQLHHLNLYPRAPTYPYYVHFRDSHRSSAATLLNTWAQQRRLFDRQRICRRIGSLLIRYWWRYTWHGWNEPQGCFAPNLSWAMGEQCRQESTTQSPGKGRESR